MKLLLILFSLIKIYFMNIVIVLFLSLFNYGCNEDESTNSTTSPPANPNDVFIQNVSFNPGNRTILAGTTITWTNNDNVAHTVTSGTPQNPTRSIFDSGNISPGETFQYTFSQAGEFNYFCDFHPTMTARITVQ